MVGCTPIQRVVDSDGLVGLQGLPVEMLRKIASDCVSDGTVELEGVPSARIAIRSALALAASSRRLHDTVRAVARSRVILRSVKQNACALATLVEHPSWAKEIRTLEFCSFHEDMSTRLEILLKVADAGLCVNLTIPGTIATTTIAGHCCIWQRCAGATSLKSLCLTTAEMYYSLDMRNFDDLLTVHDLTCISEAFPKLRYLELSGMILQWNLDVSAVLRAKSSASFGELHTLVFKGKYAHHSVIEWLFQAAQSSPLTTLVFAPVLDEAGRTADPEAIHLSGVAANIPRWFPQLVSLDITSYPDELFYSTLQFSSTRVEFCQTTAPYRTLRELVVRGAPLRSAKETIRAINGLDAPSLEQIHIHWGFDEWADCSDAQQMSHLSGAREALHTCSPAPRWTFHCYDAPSADLQGHIKVLEGWMDALEGRMLNSSESDSYESE